VQFIGRRPFAEQISQQVFGQLEFCFWHLSDIKADTIDVRFQAKTGSRKPAS